MCAQVVYESTKPPSPPAALGSPPPRRSRSSSQLRKHKSLTSLSPTASASADDDAAASTFSLDPFALPPLFGDDVYDHETWGAPPAVVVEEPPGVAASSAKAIVYSSQGDAARFMSSKEWQVINPAGSVIRQAVEGSLAQRKW